MFAEDMKKSGALYDYGSRIAVGMAATGGLMCAACISGLPSAPCGALAHIYADDVFAFGTMGLSGIAILGGIAFPDRESKKEDRVDRGFVIGFLGLGFVAMLLGVLVAVTLLPNAVTLCWPK